jgi:hypothetical protein
MKNTYFSVLLCLLLICCGQQGEALAGRKKVAQPYQLRSAAVALLQQTRLMYVDNRL